MMIRAYLRASTHRQDASRSKQELKSFVKSNGLQIAAFYQENVSGTKTDRPELEKLLDDSESGDILLLEKMDRLTRLPFPRWESLKASIKAKGLNIVVVDQPMTHQSLFSNSNDSTNAIQQALTSFMLDLGAAIARDDYETRYKRTREGIQKAKKLGRYQGRSVDENTVIKCKTVQLIVNSGETVTSACKAQSVSRATYYNWLKMLDQTA